MIPRLRSPRPRRFAGLALVAALTLGACGSDDDDSSGTGGDSGTPPATASDDDSSSGTGGDSGTPPATASDDESESTDAGQPQAGGVLRVTHLSYPATLDPHAGQSGFELYVLYSIFDTLVAIDSRTGETSPMLASEWEFTTPTELVMTIREGVTFQDGEPLDAEAVLYNLERALEGSETAGELEAVSGVEVTGPMEVTLTLSEPNAALPAILSGRAGMLVSPKAAEEAGDDFGSAPVGAGPFSVANIVVNESIELVRNDTYWQSGLPHLDGITFTIIPDEQTAGNALVAGEADFVLSLDVQDLGRLEGDPNVVLHTGASSGWFKCNFNVNSEALADPRVRQALNYAVNRDALVEILTGGLGEASTGAVVQESHWAYPTDSMPAYTYDPDRARELLAEAGAEGLTITGVTAAGATFEAQMAALAAQFEEVGVTFDITVLDLAQARPAFAERGEFDLFCVPIAGRPDPHQLYSAQVYGLIPPPWEPSAELQAAMDATVAVEDHAERVAAYNDLMQMIVIDDPLYLAEMFPGAAQGHSPAVQGYDFHPAPPYGLNELWLSS